MVRVPAQRKVDLEVQHVILNMVPECGTFPMHIIWVDSYARAIYELVASVPLEKLTPSAWRDTSNILCC